MLQILITLVSKVYPSKMKPCFNRILYFIDDLRAHPDVKNYGAEVNLFVDHSQIIQLESLRAGIWGNKSLWGRVLIYKG